jgi:arsenite methyltransferase
VNNELECWSNWLLRNRLRGPRGRETLEFLAAIRDRVLDRARLSPGDYVLDVGAGDGLLAFGALRRVGAAGLVVVDDISQEELDTCARIADEARVAHRLRFVRNSAVDLADVPDASVDAVVLRSVLSSVRDRAAAAAEFRRVLRPGGRLSLFEPLSSITQDRPPFGLDTGPIASLEARVAAARGPETEGGMEGCAAFDERDLLALFEAAGFAHLDLELHLTTRREREDPGWLEARLDGPARGRFPTLRAAIDAVLTPTEAAQYLEFFRHAVSTSGVAIRQGSVYLSGCLGRSEADALRP